jgi:hypothetical protein
MLSCKEHPQSCPSPRLCVTFRNLLVFYGEEFLRPHPATKPEDRPLSAVRDCLDAVQFRKCR